jgi:hypothetical protein
MSSNSPGSLNDAIAIALARLVDDIQVRREPSHDDIRFQIQRVGLTPGDPHAQNQPVGKFKRVRAVLNWAMAHDENAGRQFVGNFVALIRGLGGFRETSPNYCGQEPIETAVSAFASEGYILALNGELTPILLDSLAGVELSSALDAYVRRAKRGAQDSALVTGTGKDLLEAVAAHIMTERGTFVAGWNFPMLLGQTFLALDLATPHHKEEAGESPFRKMERGFYALGCGVNALRNKQGTGHGRAWLPTVTDAEARNAIESMGIIAEYLLMRHRKN